MDIWSIGCIFAEMVRHCNLVLCVYLYVSEPGKIKERVCVRILNFQFVQFRRGLLYFPTIKVDNDFPADQQQILIMR